MKKLSAVDILVLALVIIGGINWGLVGLFNFNLVSMILGDMTLLSRVVYVLVGAAALYAIADSMKFAKRE